MPHAYIYMLCRRLRSVCYPAEYVGRMAATMGKRREKKVNLHTHPKCRIMKAGGNMEKLASS